MESAQKQAEQEQVDGWIMYIIYRDHGKVLNDCVIVKERHAGTL